MPATNILGGPIRIDLPATCVARCTRKGVLCAGAKELAESAAADRPLSELADDLRGRDDRAET